MHNTVGGAMAGPGSHQLTNTRMPNHDTSVVIQQAMPSPQSSSVITQAPSTNRQIGWVHFHLLVSLVLCLLQLPMGPDVVLVSSWFLRSSCMQDQMLFSWFLRLQSLHLTLPAWARTPAAHVADCGEWPDYSRCGTLVQKGWNAVLTGKSCFLHPVFCFYLLMIILHVFSITALGRKTKCLWSWSFNFLQWEFWVSYGIQLFLMSSV